MARTFDSKLNAAVIRTTDCPKCNTPKGVKCITYGGRTMGFAHGDRNREYEKKLEYAVQNPVDENLDPIKPKDTSYQEATPGQIEAMTTVQPNWTEAYNTGNAQQVASAIMGRSPDEMRERNKLVAEVVGGIKLSFQLMSQDAAIQRIAEAIVDGEPWLKEYRAG